MELNIPAIKGIGDSLVYFVDRWHGKDGATAGAIGNISIYDVDFVPIAGAPDRPAGVGLHFIDHLTHNVERGRMQVWADFYERIFGFREIRYFDIKGKMTGLHSRALCSPCGKIRIPINESADDKSQIEEYLREYRGEGIQHLALACQDIHASVEALRARGIGLLDTPDRYYDLLEQRLPGHGEDLARLRKNRILLDGTTKGQRPELLLQIFTETVIGPIFFELIQRKGDEGFGEGNFQALFQAMEADQVKRGVLS
jgi:4-hydroxyphenylpyruvate dioxygenase